MTLATRSNVVPGGYRGVSVVRLGGPLSGHDLEQHFLGREAYRRTRFLVVHGDDGTALLHVVKESAGPLFAPITGVEVLAGRCAYVVAPAADTAVPSVLAALAAERAPGARAVVVRGRYEHVSFILNPDPLRLVVQEITPPDPPKLLDQVRRLLAVAEELPPMVPVADTVTFEELAGRARGPRYLLPCHGSGVRVPGAATAYLDRRPEREPWTLLGCARSQEIHQWFYGDRPPSVDICPRRRPGPAGPVITKCCLLEDRIERADGRVVVPWGASLGQVREALGAVAHSWEPRWRPV